MPKGIFKNPIERNRKISLTHKGLKHSEESKSKMSFSKLGNTNGFKKGHSLNKGRILSNEAKQRMSLARKGLNTWMLGRKMPEETKRKISESSKGEKSWRWIKDRTKLKKGREKSYDTQYKYWMLEVKKRDKWKCRIADENCDGRLEAHHILNWVDYPELRYEINNGITLCHFHHPRKRKDEIKLSPYFKELVMNVN